MKYFALIVAALTVSFGFAQSQVVLRTEGAEGKKQTETAIYFGETADLWIQNFDDPSRLTLRGGPFQRVNGYKVSEFVSWVPETGALSLNPNIGRATANKAEKTFWEVGLYVPLNSKASWSLALYDARWLKRFSAEIAAGPVVYGKWTETSGDFVSLGLALEVKPKGGNGCFYGRVARNLVTDTNEFRMQYAVGF